MDTETLHQRVLATAKKHPNKVALFDEATGKEITFKQLMIFTHIIASKIRKLGETRIGVLIPNSAGCFATVLGASFASVTPIIINYSTDAIRNCSYAQKKCDFKFIITSKKLLKKLGIRKTDGMIFLEDWVAELTLADKIKGLLKFKLARPQTGTERSEDTAVILFTSGSEKDPKGVELSHKNIISNLESINQHFHFSDKDVFVSVLPVFHIFGLTTSFWLPLTLGCSTVVHPSPLEYEKIVKSVRDHKGSVLPATPTFFWGYLRKSKPGDFTSLKHPIAGGDKLPEKIREAYREQHGIDIYEGYGATETSPVISSNCKAHNKPGSIGRTLPAVKVKIADLTTDKELGVNQVGKILVKGDLVMKGYFDDSEATSRFIKAGWYDTGDMGLIDEDGYLWHKGRLRRFSKIGGEMVSLVAIEHELEKCLPEDSLCCVVEASHPTRGSEIVAVLTKEMDQMELVDALKGKLPPLSMPKKVKVMKNLPVMGNGKVDFRQVTSIVQKEL